MTTNSPTLARNGATGFPRIRQYATARRVADKNAPTHTAYTLKRETHTVSCYIEVGEARIDRFGEIHCVYVDRLPVGGFTGKICLAPVNAEPRATVRLTPHVLPAAEEEAGPSLLIKLD